MDAPAYPWLKSYPSNVKWDQTFEPKPLYHNIDQAVQRFPDRPALDFLDKKYNYAELGRLVARAPGVCTVQVSALGLAEREEALDRLERMLQPLAGEAGRV